MKICIIGNSHIAALKMAWDTGIEKQFPNIEPVFFGARGRLLNDLVVKNGLLAPGSKDLAKSFVLTSRGQRYIDPALFDVFLIYGFGAEITKVLKKKSGAASKGVNAKMIVNYWETSGMLQVSRQIRAVTQKPVYCGLAPLVAQKKSTRRIKVYDRFVRRSNKAVFHPERFALVAQPPQTLTKRCATRKKFSAGSTRLKVDKKAKQRHPKRDALHMNARYGAIWLRCFLKSIAAKTVQT